MKCFDFSHWNLSVSTQGLLFFAQSMEEMLFHYGHDSLKVPALNFRFLCVEIQSTIIKIEDEIVDKGNMRPLMEELKDSFQHDYIAQKLFGTDFDSLFFTKNADGEINRSCSDLFKDPGSESSLKRIKRVIDYLLSEMQLDDRYYTILKESIAETIKISPFGISEQDRLYQLSKTLLTDLINYAYSQEYIFWVVNDIFYNKSRRVDDIDTTLELFWAHFDFEEKEYTVILPLKLSASQKHLRHFKNVTVKNNDEGLFGNSCKWIIELPINAMDQYTAQAHATDLVSFFVSLLQYNNHKSQSYNTDQAIVILDDSERGAKFKYVLKAQASILTAYKNLHLGVK